MIRAVNLKTEYLKNPLGIDVEKPQLMWNVENAAAQSAYQVYAEADGQKIWDSGKVKSCKMVGIPYPHALISGQRAIWRVKLWDENGNEGEWSEPAFFEAGLLKASDWQAKWITGNYKVNKKRRYPVDCFRKEFTVDRQVKSARLYITACGLYEAKLDGGKIGEFCLAPGITDYNRRIQYQTYDVTAGLSVGAHSLTVQLADGWYRGSTGAWGLRNQYGTETKLLVQLEIAYEDGNRNIICTDGGWDWSNDGPIRFADNKDGEIVDASMTPSYSGKAKVTSHGVIPTASNNVPVTEHERFSPRTITTTAGKTVLDFGQNIAGYIEFTVQAGKGQRILLRFGEMLDENGEFTQKNIQCVNKKIISPLQQISYTCKDGENHYKTAFAIFGFRYVLVETDAEFRPGDFTAVAVYSDMARTGFFESSNELLNRFVEATVWSAKGNSADIPTDCPTRERHGWAGDAQIFFETASYLFDYAAFSKKYLCDLYDWQRGNGCLPQIAPYGGVDSYMYTMNGSVGWSDAGILIPYRFSRHYGDKEILAEYYERMKRYAEFMVHRLGKSGFMAKPLGLNGEAKKYAVNTGQSYGEWAEPADIHPNKWTDMIAPHPEESTAYTAYVLEIMAEIAAELGKTEDAERFHGKAEGCRRAYQALSKKSAFTLDTDRQARLVRPLAFGLLDKEQTAYARSRLIQAMEHYGWRLGTGFLSTPLILDVLADIDLEAAYRLLENEKMPGWLFMPKNGATTVWESWEGTGAQGGIASLNHYSKGAVCEWLFRTMCGIRMDGENHFIIAPKPGGSFTYAKAAYDSIYGRVESGWKKEGKRTPKLVYDIVIPANCTAEVILPGSEGIKVTVGAYHFEDA